MFSHKRPAVLGRFSRAGDTWLASFHHAPYPHNHDDIDGAGAFEGARNRSGATTYAVVSSALAVRRSGKTALLLALCRKLRDRHQLGVVTNDIFTKEDAEFLMRHDALPANRIRAVETGGCPHTAIRDDISPNLVALEGLMDDLRPELLFVESGGDNLAAQFSRDLADYTIYVIDVSGGDKIPRKGGPGITQSDYGHQQGRSPPLVGATRRDGPHARTMRGAARFCLLR